MRYIVGIVIGIFLTMYFPEITETVDRTFCSVTKDNVLR